MKKETKWKNIRILNKKKEAIYVHFILSLIFQDPALN
jgi:hypothetical protein